MFAPIRVTVARAVLALVLLPAVAHAQTDTASIVGTVKDASGAVLPGVAVTATETARDYQIKAVVSSGGRDFSEGYDVMQHRRPRDAVSLS